MFELNLFNSIINDAQEELQHLTLNCYQTTIGFILCHQYINTQSLLDWSISISLTDMIFRRIIQYGLEWFIPESLSFLYQNKKLSQFLSLACLSYLFQQSLLILMMSKILYFLFYIFCQLFSHQPLQIFVIAYYLHNAWLILPLIIKLCLSFVFWIDSLLSLQILKRIAVSPILLTWLKEFGVQKKDVMSLGRMHANRHDLSYQYQDMMALQKTTVEAAFAKFKYPEELIQFKQYLALRYKESPAIYRAPDGQSHSLPIDSKRLSYFLLGKDIFQTNEILKAYYQHPIHTVWRVLQSENSWQDKNNDYHQSHKFYSRMDYLQWFVYLWQEENLQSKDEHFIQLLAHLCRLGNKERQAEGPIYVVEVDNLSADRPGNEEAIQGFIIQYLSTSTGINVLTETKLKIHLHEFFKDNWEKILKTLSPLQFKQLTSLWKTIMEQDGLWSMLFDNYRGFELNLALKKSFEEQIRLSYGDILDKSQDFCEIINAYFFNRHQHDIEHHAVSFNQAIANVSRTMSSKSRL